MDLPDLRGADTDALLLQFLAVLRPCCKFKLRRSAGAGLPFLDDYGVPAPLFRHNARTGLRADENC